MMISYISTADINIDKVDTVCTISSWQRCQRMLGQFSLFLIAQLGKLGHKTACPNNKAVCVKLQNQNILIVCIPN